MEFGITNSHFPMESLLMLLKMIQKSVSHSEILASSGNTLSFTHHHHKDYVHHHKC